MVLSRQANCILLIGILFTTPVYAKTESDSRDAKSVVLYGNNNGTIVPIKVDADGVIDTAGGAGDVVGPSSSTDNAIVRFDGTTGKLVQNSGVTIDDSNNIVTTGALSAGGANPASGGAIRLPHGIAYDIRARNNANDSDMILLRTAAGDDTIYIGAGANVAIAGNVSLNNSGKLHGATALGVNSAATAYQLDVVGSGSNIWTAHIQKGASNTAGLFIDSSAGTSPTSSALAIYSDAGNAAHITLAYNGAAVFNEAGNDADFRVEGDTDANLLFIDASTDRIGIGSATPATKLDVTGTGTFSTSISTPLLDLSGTGTINGLDAIDATGEATLESTLDIGGEVASTGMASTVIADSVTVTGWVMGASTATTPSADDNDTSLATTAYVQTEINAMGGRSLTAASGSMDADAELYTDTKCIWIENPTSSDDLKSIWFAKQAATLTSIWAESDQTVTFMLQVDDGSPADVDSVDLAPAAGTAEDTSLNGDTTMAAGDRLDIDVASTSGTPTWCSICWTFTYDD